MSTGTTGGRAAHHAYRASKHAVLAMTCSVALEYAQRDIRVTALCAGATTTLGMQQARAAMRAVGFIAA